MYVVHVVMWNTSPATPPEVYITRTIMLLGSSPLLSHDRRPSTSFDDNTYIL